MPQDALLRKTEQNQIFDLIVGNGLNPADFCWGEKTTREGDGMYTYEVRASVLTHRATGYYFLFGDYNVEFSPGQRRKVDWERGIQAFVLKQSICEKWIRELKKEIAAPDLWETVLQNSEFRELTDVLQSENTGFTHAEQKYISDQLRGISDSVLTSVELQSEQRQLIEAQIRYTEEAANRLGRIDWKGVLVNTLFTIAVTAAFTPDTTRQLFHTAASAFMPLYQAVSGILP